MIEATFRGIGERRPQSEFRPKRRKMRFNPGALQWCVRMFQADCNNCQAKRAPSSIAITMVLSAGVIVRFFNAIVSDNQYVFGYTEMQITQSGHRGDGSLVVEAKNFVWTPIFFDVIAQDSPGENPSLWPAPLQRNHNLFRQLRFLHDLLVCQVTKLSQRARFFYG